MYCVSCGNKVQEADKFCTSCGMVIEKNNDNQINNDNIKIENNKKKTNKILFASIGGVILFITLIAAFAYNIVSSTLEKDKDANNIFIGTWTLNDNNKLYEENYFTFNSDNTFSWGSDIQGTYTGTYFIDKGMKSTGESKIYKDEKYYYYTITMMIEKLTKKDGTVITDSNEIKDVIYILGITYDGEDMYVINKTSFNQFYLKKV